MTDHVNRLEQLELIERYNELQRAVPIYLQALEHIAGVDTGPSGKIAQDALREADRGAPRAPGDG